MKTPLLGFFTLGAKNLLKFFPLIFFQRPKVFAARVKIFSKDLENSDFRQPAPEILKPLGLFVGPLRLQLEDSKVFRIQTPSSYRQRPGVGPKPNALQAGPNTKAQRMEAAHSIADEDFRGIFT